jgi:bifunctional polynucleotide phosphatase/kinase
MEWINEDNYLIGRYKTDDNNNLNIVMFDLDHTIIKPTDNKTFSKTDKDWEFYNDTIVDKLRKLNVDNEVIIVSNQKGFSTNKTDIDTWKSKIERMNKKLKIPISIYASKYDDQYRKPRIGLFELIKNKNKNKNVLFYCGDGGGKAKRDGYKKDFSDTDLKFALNIGTEFKHRDEFVSTDLNVFFKTKINYNIDYVDLSKIKMKMKMKKKGLNNNDQTMIINVGCAGSGKSYFSNKYYVDHIIINQDICKTSVKCVKECEKAIKNGDSVVIDNTNPSKEVRKKYIDIANKYNVKVKCVYFNIDRNLARHNNVYRSLKNIKIKIVPTIAYNIYFKKFEYPEESEGFELQVKEFILEDNVDDIYWNYLY